MEKKASDIEEVIFKHYEVKNKKEFKEKTGFNYEISQTYGWRTSTDTFYVYISFIDRFNNSMTTISTATIVKGSSDKEIISKVEKKIKYKKRQLTTLGKRRQAVMRIFRDHISQEFSISPEIIKDSDMIFEDHKSIKIAKVSRFFTCTLSDTNVYISKPYYYNSLKEFNNLYSYYFNKTLDSITNFKLIEDDSN